MSELSDKDNKIIVLLCFFIPFSTGQFVISYRFNGKIFTTANVKQKQVFKSKKNPVFKKFVTQLLSLTIIIQIEFYFIDFKKN